MERDRPTVRKYALALGLALSAGIAIAIAFVVLVPGAGLGAGAIAVLFRVSPNRRQPAASWLAFGSVLSVVMWFAFTGLLASYVTLAQSFGETYGPLAGIIGLLIWSLLTALALFVGLAVAAQLEAVRAGSPEPRVA